MLTHPVSLKDKDLVRECQAKLLDVNTQFMSKSVAKVKFKILALEQDFYNWIW